MKKDRQPVARLLYRIDEVALAIGVSRSKAYEMVVERDIPSVRIAGCIRVPCAALEALIDKLLTQATQKELRVNKPYDVDAILGEVGDRDVVEHQ